MKKLINAIIISIIVLFISMSLSMGGFPPENEQNKSVKVINFLNGAPGDDPFFDSAVRGISRAQQELGLDVEIVEVGYDPTLWQPALEDVAAHGDYDILVAGTGQMAELLQEVAQKHPDKKFILYDASVNYTECDCKNVYSVLYKQNEGSYLAGVYAGLMTESGTIGVIGGQDTPVINDFIAGYVQGAKEVRPDIKVLGAYAGSWNDSAMGRQLAREMYGQGADIIFQVAGGSGIGVFQAAQESGKYAIGVDSDQAQIIEHKDPAQAGVILTSMMKNVDLSLYRALKLHLEGKLPFGRAEHLGIREGGVGLAKNRYYEEATPVAVRTRINQTENDLKNGTIVVDTAFI